MSELDNYIAMAVSRDEQTALASYKKKQGIKLNLFIWPLFVLLVLSQGKVLLHHHELVPDEHHIANIDQLYDEAEAELTDRFHRGESLLEAFNDPLLNASVGILPTGENKVVLFYLGDHEDGHGRELVFSKG